jgi:hypothetical protein
MRKQQYVGILGQHEALYLQRHAEGNYAGGKLCNTRHEMKQKNWIVVNLVMSTGIKVVTPVVMISTFF